MGKTAMDKVWSHDPLLSNQVPTQLSHSTYCVLITHVSFIYYFESVLNLVKSFPCVACILVFQNKFRCLFLPLQFTMPWIHKILNLWKRAMFTYESPDKLKIGLDPFEFTQLIFPNVTRSSLNFYSRVLYGCF